MKLSDIVSISGMPGLHKVLGRNKNGLIVETIDATKKKFATNARQRVSVLGDIAMFTEEGEAKLWQILKTIAEKEKAGAKVPDSKAEGEELIAFMKQVLPDYDREKVYTSDMKKLFLWYTTLKPEMDLLKLQSEEEAEEEGATGEAKPVKTTAKPAVKNIKTAAPKTSAGTKTKTTTPRKMGS